MIVRGLGIGVVTGGMRCTPLVAKWPGISPWFVSMVFLWDRIGKRVMVGMLNWRDETSFMVYIGCVSGDSRFRF